MASRTGAIAVTGAAIGVLVLAACSGARGPQGNEASAAVEGTAYAADGAVLAFDTGMGRLLRADAEGLAAYEPGEGWMTVPLPEAAPATGVVVVPGERTALYVSGLGFGIDKSVDGGNTWSEANVGLSGLDVTALALHSFRPETLFAWVDGIGIFRSENGGTSWLRMPDQGPPDTHVRFLAHSDLPGSMNTGWLYAATPTGAYLSMDCF